MLCRTTILYNFAYHLLCATRYLLLRHMLSLFSGTDAIDTRYKKAYFVTMKRIDDRCYDALRPIKIQRDFYEDGEGSCLISFGKTQVLCVATIEERVPPHIKGSGGGWITAEYNMLPRSSTPRIQRERKKVGGRTYEIQRLIGRALRSVTRMDGWGERSIIIDCDVIKADGGTRTASVTGAFVALALAFKEIKKRGLDKGVENFNPEFPLNTFVSAVSMGVFKDQPVLDLNYHEDSQAETDMNVVLSEKGQIIEIQGTAEAHPMEETQFNELLKLGKLGCQKLCEYQREVVGELSW